MKLAFTWREGDIVLILVNPAKMLSKCWNFKVEKVLSRENMPIEGRSNHQQVTDELVKNYNEILKSGDAKSAIGKGLFETGHNWIQWYAPIEKASAYVERHSGFTVE